MMYMVLVSFILGIVFTLCIEVVLIYQWWTRKPLEEPSSHAPRTKVKNPEVKIVEQTFCL